MISDLEQVLQAMRHRLDRAIRNGEEPIAELWSAAMEYVEQARRLVVKAGGDARIYKTVTVEACDDASMYPEEFIVERCKATYKGAALERSMWFSLKRRIGADHVMTPYGALPYYASDTCPRGSIEWLS